MVHNVLKILRFVLTGNRKINGCPGRSAAPMATTLKSVITAFASRKQKTIYYIYPPKMG